MMLRIVVARLSETEKAPIEGLTVDDFAGSRGRRRRLA
jgi:hypothetical protein